jgi:hypothetical protein
MFANGIKEDQERTERKEKMAGLIIPLSGN